MAELDELPSPPPTHRPSVVGQRRGPYKPVLPVGVAGGLGHERRQRRIDMAARAALAVLNAKDDAATHKDVVREVAEAMARIAHPDSPGLFDEVSSAAMAAATVGMVWSQAREMRAGLATTGIRVANEHATDAARKSARAERAPAVHGSGGREAGERWEGITRKLGERAP
eukprot:COSAG02_NODE_5973_length_3901_cov_1.859811_4_plen_169_part_01